MVGEEKMAIQIMADLYDCSMLIDDTGAVTEAAHKAIRYVGAHIVEECIHRFEPIGITYFAVISTSHFSIHTWPEYRYASGRVRIQTIQRDIKGEEGGGICFTE